MICMIDIGLAYRGRAFVGTISPLIICSCPLVKVRRVLNPLDEVSGSYLWVGRKGVYCNVVPGASGIINVVLTRYCPDGDPKTSTFELFADSEVLRGSLKFPRRSTRTELLNLHNIHKKESNLIMKIVRSSLFMENPNNYDSTLVARLAWHSKKSERPLNKYEMIEVMILI